MRAQFQGMADKDLEKPENNPFMPGSKNNSGLSTEELSNELIPETLKDGSILAKVSTEGSLEANGVMLTKESDGTFKLSRDGGAWEVQGITGEELQELEKFFK